MLRNKIFKYILMGIMIGSSILLTRFISIQFAIYRISPGFAPIFAIAILFGWMDAAIVAGLSDIFGYLMYSQGMVYHPGILIIAIISGGIYGYFFHQQKLNDYTIIKTIVLVELIRLIFNSLFLSQIINGDLLVINLYLWLATLISRILQSVAMALVNYIALKLVVIRTINIYNKHIKKLP